ncbi:MAG: hypothetical protein HC896_15975, partial [Bacteroidales bacterium]|nr:hypothetical protein [Bacteroidales bacterium]
MPNITYLKNKDIDLKKWDACIDNSVNPLIYPLSWYLDCVADNWDGLVLGDYEAVMPLPWRQKYGLKYIYQPVFAQQLGIFGLREEHLNASAFLKKVPLKFVKVDYCFNYMNHGYGNVKTRERTNTILPLNKSYEELYANFSKSHRKNIKKAIQQDILVKEQFHLKEEYVQFYKESIFRLITYKRYINAHLPFERLVRHALSYKKGVFYVAYGLDNKLYGQIFYVNYFKRY